MATPARKVHWNAFSPGFSDISSPSSNASSESFASTSSLQYINSQLVAHGFITAPGLSLDGISNSEMDRTVKCLLELLGQRMKDMSRTENLTTDVRTLSYDHERLRSMHTAASDKAANFEREMNLHKSRLQATTRTLQASEQANKQTTAELQRTRGILHAVRATHQSELKKREKDIEKMSEKWQKLADSQTKLSALGSGLKLANSRLPAGDIPKTQPFLELAAQDAEKARAQAVAECSTLKRVILNAVNELQSVLHDMAGSDIAEPTPFTLATLFPYSAPGNSADNLASVLLSLRDSIQDIKPEPRSPPQTFDEERDQMQAVINSLQVELEAAKAQAESRNADSSKNLEVQVLVDKFASDPRLLAGQEPDVSVDLMTVPQHDELQERLVDMRQQLEDERRKFTDATIRLGHERANLEAERQKLQEEKRSWQLEMMLSELPPTPLNGGSSLPTPEFKAPPRSPRRVPHKSPVKKSSAKTAIRTTTRVRRRSSLLASPTKKPRVEPAYETEVITQAHIPIPFKATIPISKSDERIPPAPSMSSNLLPTSFVLPPPSPQAALPPSTLPSLLSSRSLLPTLHPETPLEEGAVVQSTTPPSPSPPEVPQTPQPHLRPYPVAKPFAPRMIHAYSPARPSPLSRILRLGNSPTSPLFTDGSSSGLEALNEEDESDHPFLSPGPQLTLAQELGVPDSPPERSESPLLDKAPNLVLPRPPVPKGKTKAGSSSMTTTKSKVAPGPKPSTMASKSQGVVGLKEKENAATARHVPTAARTTTSKPPAVSQPTVKPVITLATSRVRVTAKGPVGGRTDGPRRVPINEVSRARRP